jgi:hypothetical protein
MKTSSQTDYSASVSWDFANRKNPSDTETLVFRVLAFGDVEDVRRLFRDVPKKRILEVFEARIADFDPKTAHFFKDVLKSKSPLVHSPGLYDQIDAPVFTRNARFA